MSIADRAQIEILEPAGVAALEQSVNRADTAGAMFSVVSSPEMVFRHAVTLAINAIESRGSLLRRFLTLGPYEEDGPIPRHLEGKRLTDEECTKAVGLIYSHAINCFKGYLAEVFALGSVVTIVDRLRELERLPQSSRIFVGDSAMPVGGSRGADKGADVHILTDLATGPVLEAVGEIKSYPVSLDRLGRQLAAHRSRAVHGLRIKSSMETVQDIQPVESARGILSISAAPSTWRLSRAFRFTEENGQSLLHGEELREIPGDVITQVGGSHWHIVLGWSKEALASIAYSLTYWYMEELGREIFYGRSSSPWPEMTPEDAGVNAAKEKLYYAIRRCATPGAEQRAIALYNAYGFGYALGTSFKDAAGRRQMLWPADLREIISSGKTKDGFKLRP